MNALARPARRRTGTGTVSYHSLTNTWRLRTPGQHGQQLSGFPTREAAELVLENHIRGFADPLEVRRRRRPGYLLRATLKHAIELAHELDVDIKELLGGMTGKRKKKRRQRDHEQQDQGTNLSHAPGLARCRDDIDP